MGNGKCSLMEAFTQLTESEREAVRKMWRLERSIHKARVRPKKQGET